MQAGCRRFDSVWLHQVALERVSRIASRDCPDCFAVAGIDIVKEELDRPLIGFQVWFERRHCLTKIRRGPAGNFPVGGISRA